MNEPVRAGVADSNAPVGNGYAHPAEVAGAPIGEFGYLVALLVIAAADFAVFTQIVADVMQDVDDLLVWAAVAGFTLTSLVLAHSVGRVLRDRAAGYGTSGPRVVPLLVSVWLLLGVAGFLVRFVVAQTSADEDEAWFQQLSGAVLFLTLYLASGAVAGIGVYFTRNPLRVQYRTTFRAYRRSVNRLARSQPPYQRALSVVELHARGEQREEQNYRAARAQRIAFADELKRYAAALMAAHLQSPSATDGMTLPDRRPLPGPPHLPASPPEDDETTRREP